MKPPNKFKLKTIKQGFSHLQQHNYRRKCIWECNITRKFTKHKISLSKGDCIYIFSDGFVDQFGGNEGRKFMSKRFKDLLLANYSTPMLEQENKLIKTFETWKGSREQVDDLLVIGIRI